MKLNEILLEKEKIIRRSSETSMLEAIDFIRMNCSEIVNVYKKNKVRLYRGISSSFHFRFGDSLIRSRKSRNTDNYYTIIMDNDPSWKIFPKRSESFICSTDFNYSKDYGNVYLVFPVNGTKIGQCPGRDMWDTSIPKTREMLDEFNNFIIQLGDIYKIKLSDDNYESFLSSLKQIQEKYNKEPNYFYEKIDSWVLTPHMQSLFKKNNYNFYKMFLDILSVENFKLWTTKNFNVFGHKECWFSGKCIFVNASEPISMGSKMVKDFMKNKKAGNPEVKDLTIDEFIKAL